MIVYCIFACSPNVSRLVEKLAPLRAPNVLVGIVFRLFVRTFVPHFRRLRYHVNASVLSTFPSSIDRVVRRKCLVFVRMVPVPRWKGSEPLRREAVFPQVRFFPN